MTLPQHSMYWLCSKGKIQQCLQRQDTEADGTFASGWWISKKAMKIAEGKQFTKQAIW